MTTLTATGDSRSIATTATEGYSEASQQPPQQQQQGSALRQLFLLCSVTQSQHAGGPSVSSKASSSAPRSPGVVLNDRRPAVEAQVAALQGKTFSSRNPAPAPPPISALNTKATHHHQVELSLMGAYRLALLCCPRDAPRDELEQMLYRGARAFPKANEPLRASPDSTARTVVTEKVVAEVILPWLVARGAAGAVLPEGDDTSDDAHSRIARVIDRVCHVAMDTARLATNANTDRLLHALMRHEHGLARLFHLALLGDANAGAPESLVLAPRVGRNTADGIDRVTEAEFRSLLKRLDVFPSIVSAVAIRDAFRFALVSPMLQFEPYAAALIYSADNASVPPLASSATDDAAELDGTTPGFAVDERLSPSRLRLACQVEAVVQPRALCFLSFAEAILRVATSLDDDRVEGAVSAIAAATGEEPSPVDVTLSKLHFLLSWINTSPLLGRPLFVVAPLPRGDNGGTATSKRGASKSLLKASPAAPTLAATRPTSSSSKPSTKQQAAAVNHVDPMLSLLIDKPVEAVAILRGSDRLRAKKPSTPQATDESSTTPAARSATPTTKSAAVRSSRSQSPSARLVAEDSDPVTVLWPGIADRLRCRCHPVSADVVASLPDKVAFRALLAEGVNRELNEADAHEVVLGAVAPLLNLRPRRWLCSASGPLPQSPAASPERPEASSSIIGMVALRVAVGQPQSAPMVSTSVADAGKAATHPASTLLLRKPIHPIATENAITRRRTAGDERPRAAVLTAEHLLLDNPTTLGLGSETVAPPRFCAVAGTAVTVFGNYVVAVEVPPEVSKRDAFRDVLRRIDVQAYVCFSGDGAWRSVDVELLQLETPHKHPSTTDTSTVSNPNDASGTSGAADDEAHHTTGGHADATTASASSTTATLVSLAFRFRLRVPGLASLIKTDRTASPHVSPRGSFVARRGVSAVPEPEPVPPVVGHLTTVHVRLVASRRDNLVDVKAPKNNPRSVVAIRTLDEPRPVPLRLRLFADHKELQQFQANPEYGPTSTSNAIALAAIRSPALKAAARYVVFEPLTDTSNNSAA